MGRTTHDLFEPVLQAGAAPTKSYDISRLIYVAFLGGPLAIAALGTRAGFWLRAERKWLYLMAGAALLMLVGKLAWVAAYPDLNNTRTVRYLFRGLAILLYIGYRWALGPAYRRHEAMHGETQPLLRDGIIAVVGAGVVEFALLAATANAVQADG